MSKEKLSSHSPLTLLHQFAFGKGEQATSAAFSPDGSRAAVSFHGEIEGADDSLVWIWDLRKKRLEAKIPGCTHRVNDLAFSRDGETLICVGDTAKSFMGGEIALWRTRDWQRKKVIDGKELLGFRTVAVNPKSAQFITGDSVSGPGLKLRLWSPAGKCLRTFGQLAGDPGGLTYSPDGKLVAAGVSSDASASVWDVETGVRLWSQRAVAVGSGVGVKFSPDGKLLATSGDKSVAVWNVSTGERIAILKGHQRNTRALAFSPDGRFLYTTAFYEVAVWEMASGKLVAQQELAKLHLIAMTVSVDGLTLSAVHTINRDCFVLQYSLAVPAALVVDAMPPSAKIVVSELSARERALRAAVIAKPDIDAPRLKYATWLDAQQDPSGEFIRLQCELHPLDQIAKPLAAQKKRIDQLRRRTTQLLDKHFEHWLAPLAELKLRRDQVIFRRGFLHRLTLREVDIDDDSLSLLRFVPELEALELDGSAVTDAGMEHLLAVTNLSELVVTSTAITPNALKVLRKLERLIHVYQADWGNERNEELEAWKAIRNRRFLKLPPRQRRAEAFRVIPYLASYYSAVKPGGKPAISWSQTWATDGDLIYLQALPELEELDFFECHAVTSIGLKHLRPLKKLRSLSLSETSVTDVGPLRHLTGLEELDLSSLPSLKSESLRHLKALPKLRSLTMRFCDLDDQVLKHVAACSHLREFYACYNDFTREGLTQLTRLKHLETLEIDYQKDMYDLFPRRMDATHRTQ
jgi:uncharacterized protein (TIGR02996 family)